MKGRATLVMLIIIIVMVSFSRCTSSPPFALGNKDFDGDNIPDEIIVENTICGWKGSCDRIFFKSSSSDELLKIIESKIDKSSVLIIDINCDGNMDIVYETTYYPNEIEFTLGNGDGTFQKPREINTKDLICR